MARFETPPTTPADVPRGRPRDPSREAAIVDACLTVLQADGYDRLTLERVASEAGVGKATIYRRWSSKAALVADALATRKPSVESIDTGSLRGDLEVLADAMCARTSAEAQTIFAAASSAMARDPELFRAFQDRISGPRRERLQRIFTQAEARGELPAGLDVAMVVDTVSALTAQHVVLHGAPAPAPYVRRIVEQVVMPLVGMEPAPATTPTTEAGH